MFFSVPDFHFAWIGDRIQTPSKSGTQQKCPLSWALIQPPRDFELMVTVSIHRDNLEWRNEIPLRLLWLDLDFERSGNFNLCQMYGWADLTFLLDYFDFWTLSTQAPCGILQFKKKPNFSNPAFEKRMEHPPWKVSLFVGHEFSLERDNKPYLKFHMKNIVLLIYRMMSRILGFDGYIANFGATLAGRCLGRFDGAHRRTQLTNFLILTPCDIYTLSLAPCEFWIWFIHLGFER
jgi:hypothetical protein